MLIILSATKHTDLTQGIHEDVSNDLARERGTREKYCSLLPSNQGGMLDRLGGAPTMTLGSDAMDHNASGSTLHAGSSYSTNTTEFTDGIYEDAREAAEGAKSASTNLNIGVHDSPSSLPTTGGGILDKLKENISGFSGGNGKPRNESAMDSGASSGIKNTDLTDGIYEDAQRDIESVKSATARK